MKLGQAIVFRVRISELEYSSSYFLPSIISSLGSVVVGGESLIKAMYAAQNLPGLRPCLQSPSEPSLAFVRYDMAKSKGKRKNRKGAISTILKSEHNKVGMVLVSEKNNVVTVASIIM